MEILPQITPFSPSPKGHILPTDMQDPFAWMTAIGTRQPTTQATEEQLLTSPAAVDKVFSSLSSGSFVALENLDRDPHCAVKNGSQTGVIRIAVGDAVYVMNTRLPAFRNFDLGKYPVRFLVESAYSSSTMLKKLGIDRPVHCLETAGALTTSFGHVAEAEYRKHGMLGAFQLFWSRMDPSQQSWYKKLCKARPFLTNIPPFKVDTACYANILESWRTDDDKKGKYTEWKGMLTEHGDRFPIRMKPYAAVTGRFSTATPSLQSMDRNLRKAFLAEEGMTLISGDYHQMQPRIVAEVSGDTEFRKIFEEGRDLYKVWASTFYEKPEDEVTKAERQSFKSVSLPWLYGMHPNNLVAKLMADSQNADLGGGMTAAQAHAGLLAFHKRFSVLGQWKTRLGNQALQRGYVTTYSDRHIPLWGGAYKAACYWAQGTEVEMMLQLVIMIGTRLKDEFPSAHIKLFLHDELILEAPDDIAEEIADLLERSMKEVFQQNFPNAPTLNLLDIHRGKTWGDLK